MSAGDVLAVTVLVNCHSIDPVLQRCCPVLKAFTFPMVVVPL
jgi:hypothetical protein